MVCLTDINSSDADDYVGRGEKAPALIAQEPFCPSGLTVISNSKVYYNGAVKPHLVYGVTRSWPYIEVVDTRRSAHLNALSGC